jgi:cell division protein FtsW
MKSIQKLKMDFFFTIVLISLIGFGTSFIFSTSSIVGLNYYNNMYTFLIKHVVNLILGIFALIVVAKIPFQKLRKYIFWMNLFAVATLCLTFIPGLNQSVNGATRWVTILGFSFQPSEITKIVMIFTLAHMIDIRRHSDELNKFRRGVLPIVLYLLLFGGLIILEKHLSAIMIIGFVTLTMLFLGGLSARYFVLLGTGIGVAGVFGVLLQPYRMARVFGFLNPENDPLGKGYHIIQSWYALGSGEWTGLGLGMSRQKFTWLPENHTDFIVAIIGEEAGFFGIVVILVLFLMFLFRGLWISWNAPDRFSLLFSAGIVLLVFFQALINMAVVSGLFPVTGIPMPFISYGGSSTIILMAGIGLIYNVNSQIELED